MTTPTPPLSGSTLKLRRLGIDTYQEPVIFMRADCHVCRSEGFAAPSRVWVQNGEHGIIATLNVVTGDFLGVGEAGLSEAAWRRLGAREGSVATVSHPRPLPSLSYVRGKIYGHTLGDQAIDQIMADITAGRYSDVELSCFITACAARGLSEHETVALTRAMVKTGERMDWGRQPIMDKHSVGGLPGNRTTLVVVPIVAACGVMMPKTSSRAITSPAGSADAMEAIAPVDLTLAHIRRVVERECGCIVWGGAVRLSPADDILIRVERVLDIDAEGQLIASVLSKKAAAGSTHVVLDIPVGPTAKVRSNQAADTLSDNLIRVGAALGLAVATLKSDGNQPVGRGIGPVLEALDALAILRRQPDAPPDLTHRSLVLAGRLLELAGHVSLNEGYALARQTLESGAAWKKFQAICLAQGGMREPQLAPHTHTVVASGYGTVASVDNRRISRLAKLAGAPQDAAAGLKLHVSLNDRVEPKQPLFTLYAGSPGELKYALGFAEANADIFRIEGET